MILFLVDSFDSVISAVLTFSFIINKETIVNLKVKIKNCKSIKIQYYNQAWI